MYVPRATYSLRMSFWTVPRSLRSLDALLLGHRDVHRQQDARRRVDRHRGGDLVQRDLPEQRLHVVQRRDRHAHLADFAVRHGVVGVVADLRRQVERHRKPGLALLQQVSVALVGFLGGGKARVLAHGPQARAVHRWAGRRVCNGYSPGKPSFVGVAFHGIRGQRQAWQLQAGGGLEALLALGELLRGRFEDLLCPAQQWFSRDMALDGRQFIMSYNLARRTGRDRNTQGHEATRRSTRAGDRNATQRPPADTA